MPILLALQALVTITLALHIYRTGRPTYWIFIVLAFPLLGALAYVFIEVLPGSREGVQLARGVRALHKRMNPTADFRARAEEVERCGSVANKVDLARECIDMGFYDHAESLLASCLTAQFAQDRQIRFLLGVARSGAERHAQAIEILEPLVAEDRAYHGYDALLLLARSHAALGHDDRAEESFLAAVDAFSGEEARGDYIAYLLRVGRMRDAELQMAEMEKRLRLNGREYERRQRKFVDDARRAMQAAGASVAVH